MASSLPFAGGDNKFFRIQQFKGLNTKTNRVAIDDQEFSWLENMMPVADGNLTALYSNGTKIYTASGGLTIIYTYFFNIGSTTYAAVFLSDGTAVQVNTSNLVVTTITATTNTFYPGSVALGSPLPACAQYGQSGIVIVTTHSANGYYAWDGATLYKPGDPSPTWLNGGTSGTMPTGISGTCVETFLSRVWVGFGATFSFSAPGNGASFSGSLGGGTTPSSDSFLRREFTQIKQANGFLYLIADSSINVISNVQTSGSPLLTTFNNQNVDPQVGTPWHNSVQAFGRGIVFANSSGVYALVGGAAEKVSDQLDGLFIAAGVQLQIDSALTQPSSAVATINDVKVYMLILPITDPFTSAQRNVVAMWDGKKWWLGSQDKSITFVSSQELNSTLQAWGTDGSTLFPMFTTPTATLNKIYQTKLWPGEGFEVSKQSMRLYTVAEDNSGNGFTITGTLDYVLEGTGVSVSTQSITINSSSTNTTPNALTTDALVALTNDASVALTTDSGPGLTLSGSGSTSVNVRGNYIGLTMQSTSSDFTLIAHSMLYQSQSPIGA